MSIPFETPPKRKLERELGAMRPDDDWLRAVNAPWQGCTGGNVDSYDPGEDLLDEPATYHSNPGYLGTSTASMLQQSQPGSIYRTPGAGSGGHRPMAVGGPRRERAAGRSVSPRGTRTVPPAGPAREPISEGGPLVVQTGGAQY